MVTFTPEFDAFLQTIEGEVVTDTPYDGRERIVLVAAGHSWAVEPSEGDPDGDSALEPVCADRKLGG